MKNKIYSFIVSAVVFAAANVDVASAQTVHTIAGDGSPGYTGDGGAATAAAVGTPAGITYDATGNVYFTDYSNSVVRKISSSGIITTVAGSATGIYPGDGGAATNAQLGVITGIAIDATGNLYIADGGNHRIRKVSTTGIITTVAGTGTSGYTGDGGPATAARLNSPYDVAVSSTGEIIIADRFNHKVRRVDASGNISTLVGDGTAGSAGDGGAASVARLSGPVGVATDAAGNIFIADYGNKKVRRISASGIITTYAGDGTAGSIGDGGPATAARLSELIGISTDPNGNLYIAVAVTTGGNRVRVVYPSGTIVGLAGSGAPAFSGDGGPAITAEFFNVKDAIGDALGNVYICDAGNSRIRKVDAVPIAISGTASTCVGTSTTLTATPAGGEWITSSGATVTLGATTGVVTGVAAGTAIVTYRVGVSQSTTVVTINVAPTVGAITGANNVCEGASVTLANATTGGAWASSNTAVATVTSGGVVAGISAGAATITYALSNACGSAEATLPFTVNSCPTFLSEVTEDAQGISVFPNPNNGSFTLNIPQTASRVHVAVVDMLGKTVATATLPASQHREASFSLQYLPAGSYIIKVTDGEKTYRDRIIVLK